MIYQEDAAGGLAKCGGVIRITTKATNEFVNPGESHTLILDGQVERTMRRHRRVGIVLVKKVLANTTAKPIEAVSDVDRDGVQRQLRGVGFKRSIGMKSIHVAYAFLCTTTVDVDH